MKHPTITEEQSAAVERLIAFLQTPEMFALLIGPAGTGKTFCIKHFAKKVRGKLIFTAPTNKAVKVLWDSLSASDLGETYEPECRTIYSLLGLRMEANGEIKELAHPEDPVDIGKYAAVIVDEASMINQQLWYIIADTAKRQSIRFIFLGDPAQLPPVNELRSPVWGIGYQAILSTNMRNDNQILELATRIREKVDHPAPSIKLSSNNDGEEGVWALSMPQFEESLLSAVDRGLFQKPNGAKAVAWRNATVDRLNKLIRQKLFDTSEGVEFFVPGDRVIITEPAKNLDSDAILAATDEEGTVQRVEIAPHPEFGEFNCHRLVIQMDAGKTITLWALHAGSQAAFQKHLAILASAARASRRLWKDYWHFRESFHQVRHGYAITAHRAQGSTYDITFVDTRDILCNRNRQEAFRCLYVACTRPRKQLILA